MVGILIGMIVIAVVYNILSVAEGYKRATVGSSDAQITGLLTQFMASRDISNGGNGIMMSTTQMNTGSGTVPSDLSNCVNEWSGRRAFGHAHRCAGQRGAPHSGADYQRRAARACRTTSFR